MRFCGTRSGRHEGKAKEMTVVDQGGAGVKAIMGREAKRVARLLRRDRSDDQAEAARIEAGERGRLGPTPEQADQFEPHRVDEVEGAGKRQVETVRRISVNRVKQLYDRGVFDDLTYPAVLWYQRTWEASGFTLNASAASWGEAIPGERSYGAMPKTAVAAEARDLFRFARGGRRIEDDGTVTHEAWSLPADMLPTFDAVVLDEMTIADAAAAARCRYSNAALAVKHVALLLVGRVSHLLPTRAVGAPGGEVVSEERLVTLVERVATTPIDEIDPEYLDARGRMLPFEDIAAVIRARFAGEGE